MILSPPLIIPSAPRVSIFPPIMDNLQLKGGIAIKYRAEHSNVNIDFS